VDLIVQKKSRQLGIIFSGSFAGFMVMLDNNIVNISLPAIARYFNIGTGMVIQITLIYFLMLSSTMIIFGKLAEKYGIKKIFLSGFAIFTLGSLLCGISPGFYFLVGARAVQAIGGSMLFSTAISLITTFIPADKRGWAFGIFTPINSLGLMVGNPLGGLITGLLNWHWIFLVNIPVGIIAIFFAYRSIPRDAPGRSLLKGAPFDYPGGILSFAGLALLVLCLNQGRNLGWTSPVILAGLGLSLLFFALFYFRERAAKDPLLDLKIFRDRNFSLGIVASLIGFALLSGSNVLMPFYLNYVLNINLEHAGFILMTFPVIFSFLSMVTGPLSDRVSKTRLTSFGMIGGMIACLVFLFLIPRAHLGFVFLYLVIMGISYSLFISPNNNLVMSLAPKDKLAVSSSLFKLFTNIGQMFGIILMETFFTLAFPPNVHITKAILHGMPLSTLTRGFQFAYLGGAILCLLAFLFSVLIRDTSAGTVRDTGPEPHMVA